MRRRPAVSLFAVPLLALAAACGTTVPAAQLGSAGGASFGSPAVRGAPGTATGTAPGAAAGGSSTALQSGTAAGAPSGSSVSVGGASGARVPGAATLAPSTTGLAVSGRGWDAKHIYVGILTQKDFEKTFASVGYSGIDPGDTAAQAQAVVDELNQKGGAFGRTFVIRTFDVPTLNSAENPDQYAQQACTYFTQDAPVVAVFNIIETLDGTTFRSCFAQHHLPLFDGAIAPLSRSGAAALRPYFYAMATPAWDALAPVLVPRLQAQGYFKGWDPRLRQVTTAVPVIGVLVADTPLGHADEGAITAALKQSGYTKVVSFAYPPPGSNIDAAVLNFEQNGVTHVISDDVELVTFQIHAQSQNYSPRYAINTYNAPSTNLEPLGPKSQQTGEVGVGWGPTLDVDAANDPGSFSSGVTTCKAIMAKEHVTSSDRLADVFAMIVCDELRLGASAILRGNGLDGQSIFAGATAVGTSFASGFTFLSALSANRLFLPAAVRDLAYVASCSCFRYADSTNRPM